MAQPMFEVLAGVVNGVNTVFTFSTPYVAGTTALFLNGQLLMKSALPWAETDPSLGIVTIIDSECVPLTGDVLSGFAMNTDSAYVEIEEISASLQPVELLSATIEEL